MLAVHMIGNAHIDPVWLWRWPAGVGEVLATCRAACDLLDEDPGPVFTRSDVWVYQRVEEIDPALFERIRRHAAAGRWAVVGGWYVQPDCNFPREESFKRHIESGRRYFADRFGMRVTVGYNVDSFGHAASLPRILADSGYDSYVMMRPMAHEKSLPANLFRWQSTEESGGVREVITWRIQGAYCMAARDLSDHVRTSIAAAVPGVDHVMCFYGVGDHGGGPTREQVTWIHENRDAFSGARLVFSHPRAFFDQVKPLASLLPVEKGELQMHAVGCYSAGRSIKKAAREAEHGLLMAERALAVFGPRGAAGATGFTGASGVPGERATLERAWEKLMFNQFHDTYGGTAIPAAFEDALAQMGGARDDAEGVLTAALYRHAVGLPPYKWQRIVALNASEAAFEGFIEWEPWLGGWKTFDGWLADEAGAPVPFQLLPSPSLANMPGVLLWPARLGPGQMRSWSIRRGDPPKVPRTDLATAGNAVSSGRWHVAAADGRGLLSIVDRESTDPSPAIPGISLDVLDDPSDTWSHGIDRYAGSLLGSFAPTGLRIEEAGPVRAALRVDARFHQSTATVWARLYRGDPRIALEVRIDWREKLRILKLVLPVSDMASERLDGVPGGGAVRPQDGRECPVIDWTLVRRRGERRPGEHRFGVALPDCSALDSSPQALRCTLLRSPVYAWHDPARLPSDRALRFLDQGEHTFRFALLPDADPRSVNALALAMHRPPVCIDWTRGTEA